MQKWEYLEFHTSYSAEGKFALYINSEEHPVTSEDDVYLSRLLNRFGEQGWELVLWSGGQWIFKRPKS